MKILQITILCFNMNSQVQSLEIEFENDNYLGMPFVLLADGRWIKNKGFDFYVEFGATTKQVQHLSLSLYLSECDSTKDLAYICLSSSSNCCFLTFYDFLDVATTTKLIFQNRLLVMAVAQQRL